MDSTENNNTSPTDYGRQMASLFGSATLKEYDRKVARRHQFDVVYMKMAQAFAELSYARRHKVGCLIVSEDGQIISQGFNGTPSGFDNNCEFEWCDSFNDTIERVNQNGKASECAASGMSCNDCPHHILKTKPTVIHAEPNALIKCAKSHNSTIGATMYITLSPCIECAKLIISAQISRVVYLEDYHNPEGRTLLERAGIEVEQLEM